MEKNNIAKALRALATSDKNRSATARLRDVFDDVEIALKAGVSHAAILDTLHEQGFAMTAKSFESAMYRLRKKKRVISSDVQPATNAIRPAGLAEITPSVTPPVSSATPTGTLAVKITTGNPLRAYRYTHLFSSIKSIAWR